MAIDFPSAGLTVGQIFTSGGASWKWDGTKWVSNAASDGYLPLAGGTINPGPLVVNANTVALASAVVPAGSVVTMQGAVSTASAVFNIGVAGAPLFHAFRANGTAGSLSAVANGDVIGRLGASGYGTSAPQYNSAKLEFTASEAWTNTAQGSSAIIYTTPVGSSSAAATQSLQVFPSGNLTIIGGTATKPGGGSWVAPSDPQLKDTDATVPYLDGLAAIEQLRPIRYQYSGRGGVPKDGTVYVGLDAREAAQVLPSLVGTMTHHPVERDEDGEVVSQGVAETYLTVDPSELIFTLINSVRELSERLTAMEAKLAA